MYIQIGGLRIWFACVDRQFLSDLSFNCFGYSSSLLLLLVDEQRDDVRCVYCHLLVEEHGTKEMVLVLAGTYCLSSFLFTWKR